MKATRYFLEQVLRKRPYLKLEECYEILKKHVKTEIQPEGRIRYWGYVDRLGPKALRVVTLADGTIHNAFLDRTFKQE